MQKYVRACMCSYHVWVLKCTKTEQPINPDIYHFFNAKCLCSIQNQFIQNKKYSYKNNVIKKSYTKHHMIFIHSLSFHNPQLTTPSAQMISLAMARVPLLILIFYVSLSWNDVTTHHMGMAPNIIFWLKIWNMELLIIILGNCLFFRQGCAKPPIGRK